MGSQSRQELSLRTVDTSRQCGVLNIIDATQSGITKPYPVQFMGPEEMDRLVKMAVPDAT